MKVKGEGVDHTIFLDHWAMENYKPDAREVCVLFRYRSVHS